MRQKGGRRRRRGECERSEESMRRDETGKIKRESQLVEEMLVINLVYKLFVSSHSK